MRQYTQEEKDKWLREWEQAGGSAKSFAAERPFSASSLRYWKNKEVKPMGSGRNFIKVISSPVKDNRNYKMSFPSGVVLEMNELPGIEKLKAIITC